jgi:membrane-bound inhibitor of C-type lysozyme
VSIRFSAIIAALAISTGVAGSVAPAAAAMPNKVIATYQCSNIKVVATYNNVKKYVAFIYGAGHYKLPQVTSADGSKYQGKTLTWYSKGDTATLSSYPDDNVLANCTMVSKK